MDLGPLLPKLTPLPAEGETVGLQQLLGKHGFINWNQFDSLLADINCILNYQF